MNFSETLKLALAAIWAHKLRSFLTLLGMIIGVTAFMVVLSILQGFNSYVDEKLAGIGSNMITIQRFGFEDFKDSDTLALAQRRNKELTLDEYEYIKNYAQSVEMIGVKAGGSRVQLRRNGETLEDVSVDGAEPIIADIEKIDIAEGRYFTDTENRNAQRVIFIGSDVASKLFPSGSAIGQELAIRGIPYRVIGVRVAKGTVFGQPQDVFIQMPLRTYGNNFGGFRWNRALYFEMIAKNDRNFQISVDEVKTLLRIKRKIPTEEKDNFAVITPDAITGMRDSIFGSISIVILAVPAIALIVGAIVIMNIMLVAVTERTKEIGIRKSLGARQSDILKQFVFEAATLSAIGGVTGLILAKLLGLIITAYVFETRIPIWAAILAIGVSALVGILAGLYPAWKAARLDPIEALRAD